LAAQAKFWQGQQIQKGTTSFLVARNDPQSLYCFQPFVPQLTSANRLQEKHRTKEQVRIC